MAEPVDPVASAPGDPVELALRTARWRVLVEEREAQVARLAGTAAVAAAAPGGPALPATSGHWDVRAEAFDACSRAHDLGRDPLHRLLLRAVTGRRLLDVGAGTGRYAAPLATVAATVTALEPSAGMRARLVARLAEEGTANVRVLAGAWPEAAATVGSHDVVLASHVIYGTRDVAQFLDALEAAAPMRVVAIRVQPIGAQLAPLFCRVHGEPPVPEPTLDALLAVLLARGALPRLRIGPFGDGGGFAGPAAAEAWASEQLRLQPGDPRRSGLWEQVRPLLMESARGWRWRQPLHTGIVSWGAAADRPPGATP